MAKYIHTMIRVKDLDRSIRFYRDALDLRENIALIFQRLRWCISVTMKAPPS